MRLTSLILLLGLVGTALQSIGEGPSEFSGLRTTCWSNGNPREQATYANGLREGDCQRWHADGTPRAEGRYEAGRMIDEWRFYDETGSLDTTRSGRFEGGDRVSSLRL